MPTPTRAQSTRTPAPAIVPLAPILEQLADRATAAHPELAPRIARALAIVRDGLWPDDPAGTFGHRRITGQGTPGVSNVLGDRGVTYEVEGPLCSCPDRQNREAIVCAHALAVGLLNQAHRIRNARQRHQDGCGPAQLPAWAAVPGDVVALVQAPRSPAPALLAGGAEPPAPVLLPRATVDLVVHLVEESIATDANSTVGLGHRVRDALRAAGVA